MPLVEALLDQYGIEKERFHWGWISGAEAPQWARLVRDFTAQVRALGPLNWERELESKEN
jgi:coenzyme F420-reducing hydrogenase delta subunit